MRLAPTAPSRQFIERSFTVRAVHLIQPWVLRRIRCRALLSLIACAVAHPALATKPVIYDTGYEIIHKTLTPSIYWIDNERLIFEGINTADRSAAVANRDPNQVKRLKKLYVWDANSKSVRFYAEGSDLCVSNGTLHYTVRTDKTAGIRVVKAGPLGHEKQTSVPLPTKEELSWRAQSERVRGDFTCKTHLRADLSPPAPKGRRIIVLREGDGYLDAGPEGTIELVGEIRATGPGHIKLFHPGNPIPLELPMTLEQGPGWPIYSEYLGAYVTLPRPQGANPGHITSWPRGLPFSVYSFTASGHVHKVVIPYGEWGGIAWVQPTRAGWIFSGGGTPPPKAGLFLFDSTTVRKLDSGYVYEIAVSPDGCRAAVATLNRHLEMGMPTNLRILEFCREPR